MVAKDELVGGDRSNQGPVRAIFDARKHPGNWLVRGPRNQAEVVEIDARAKLKRHGRNHDVLRRHRFNISRPLELAIDVGTEQ